MAGPARAKFVRSVVGRENLTNVLGLGAAGDNFARIVGPALAGITISAFGAAPCFAANALGFLGCSSPSSASGRNAMPTPAGKVVADHRLPNSWMDCATSADCRISLHSCLHCS